MENIRNKKKLALYIKLYLFIITIVIISFQYTPVSAWSGSVYHQFNNDTNQDISLTWDAGVSNVTSLGKDASNELLSTGTNAKHYDITFTGSGMSSLTLASQYTASGVYDPGIYACRVQQDSNTRWRVWFCRGGTGYTTYVSSFNMTGVDAPPPPPPSPPTPVTGVIWATPDTVIIPQGSSVGETTITWSTTGLDTANIYVSCNSGPENLFASRNTGTVVAPWIGVGSNCVFRLKSPDGTVLSSVTVTGVQANQASTQTTTPVSGTISASPSTVIIPPGTLGTTTISWSTTGLDTANIYVSCNSGPENLFASRNTGTVVAPWIGVGSNCVFRLKSPDGTVLSSVTVTGVQVSGTISASPSTVIIPPGTLGTTTISWSTTELDTANIYVSCNSGPENLFASRNTGTVVAPWIGVGSNCVFRLKSPDGTVLSSVTVTGVQANQASTQTTTPVSGTISASPSTVIIPQGSSIGETTITWSTTGLDTANIYVSCNSGPENLFASRNTGTVVAPWIGVGSNCVFRLKSPDGTVLSSVTVTGVQVSGTISASPSTVIIPPGTLGTTTISWSTTGLDTANIYVSCNSGPENLFASLNTGTVVAPWIGVGSNCVFRLKSPDGTVLSSVTVTGVQANQAPTAKYDKTDNISYNTAIAHWEYSDPDGDPQTDIEVKVYINSDYNTGQVFTGVAAGADIRSLNIITGLIPGETYYPKIRVRDSNSTWSNWSNGTAFTTTEYPELNVDFNLRSGNTTVAKGETLTVKTGENVNAAWNITDADGGIVDGLVGTCNITSVGFNDISEAGLPLSSSKNEIVPTVLTDVTYTINLSCAAKPGGIAVNQDIVLVVESYPLITCKILKNVVSAESPIAQVEATVGNANNPYTWRIKRTIGEDYGSSITSDNITQKFTLDYTGLGLGKYNPVIEAKGSLGRTAEKPCTGDITHFADRTIREVAK